MEGLDEPKRSTLEQVRRDILAVAPEAKQCISYGLPAFKVDNMVIADFAAFKNHLSYLPHSGSVFPELAEDLAGYEKSAAPCASSRSTSPGRSGGEVDRRAAPAGLADRNAPASGPRVTAFVLVPGAGGRAWYWHLVVAELIRAGHQALAVDLPGADPAAGLGEYRDAIVAAATTLDGPVTVAAQSLGGFSAPLACDHVTVERLVLVNAMIPEPGETAAEWWDHVGWQAAAQAAAERDHRPAVDVNDLDTLFFHDLPPEILEVMRADPDAATEAPTVFSERWPLAAWPEVPTVVLSSRDDRLFPLPFQRRTASKRLGLGVHELPGGHLVALGHPHALADQLIRVGQPNRGQH